MPVIEDVTMLSQCYKHIFDPGNVNVQSLSYTHIFDQGSDNAKLCYKYVFVPGSGKW
jgi:hypothetical protein